MKNILIAISGLTPQIVTETLFALSVQKKITIDEIFVITTKRGKIVLEGNDKSSATPKAKLKIEISNLCSDYKIKVPKFTLKNNVVTAEEETVELFDVQTDKDNILFPNKTANLIKRLTNDSNNVIHASLSGGRKSMSAHLALVLSLFARLQDKLYHVLTSEKFEFKNFYPKTKEEEKALTIAEIPFVKLRSLNAPLLKTGLSYSMLVAETQLRLKFLTDDTKLVLELKLHSIKYKDKTTNLSPVEMGIYLLFVENKIAEDSGIRNNEICSIEFAHKLENILTENFHYYINEQNKNHWSKKGLTPEYFLASKSKINKKLSPLFSENEIYNEFKITTKRVYGNSSYFIKAPKNKLGINYE